MIHVPEDHATFLECQNGLEEEVQWQWTVAFFRDKKGAATRLPPLKYEPQIRASNTSLKHEPQIRALLGTAPQPSTCTIAPDLTPSPLTRTIVSHASAGDGHTKLELSSAPQVKESEAAASSVGSPSKRTVAVKYQVSINLEVRSHKEQEQAHATKQVHPSTLHPTPYILHPTPYTLHPTPYILHPTPYTLHPTL